uniref:Uncharacterized protein n=1 Tax=Chrysotila carterae TaxID=13221 RepID=A0A7S4C548_CHRCT|mmetsp:Transcript_26493/g.55678  ORF Transcript_26493/g.55678 Transcript_26493/m.55678 type:complete len:185 (+) Transcript_26493:693-1247(+)
MDITPSFIQSAGPSGDPQRRSQAASLPARPQLQLFVSASARLPFPGNSRVFVYVLGNTSSPSVIASPAADCYFAKTVPSPFACRILRPAHSACTRSVPVIAFALWPPPFGIRAPPPRCPSSSQRPCRRHGLVTGHGQSVQELMRLKTPSQWPPYAYCLRVSSRRPRHSAGASPGHFLAADAWHT